MSDVLERLHRGPCLLLDGGFGTELIARGLEPGTPPERWTLDRPADVAAVHRAYVDAGSEAIHANTFGANRARLSRYALGDRIDAINRTAVRLARESGAPGSRVRGTSSRISAPPARTCRLSAPPIPKTGGAITRNRACFSPRQGWTHFTSRR
jgi:methionine synthase I (cobalamin-dependent)